MTNTAFKATASNHNAARRIVVIGAGAAGLMAARAAALTVRQAGVGIEVLCLEKNSKAGVKILLSGGTRCNLTHNTDPRSITRAFGPADRFLQPSVGRLPPAEIDRRFNDWGVPTKVESTGKIFPASDSALHVRNALRDAVIRSGVRIHTQSAVESIQSTPDGFRLAVRIGRPGRHETLDAAVVIVTAGGRSWPRCGTTGDAYAWLESMGHRIVRTRPALVPIVGGHAWMAALSGITIADVIATVHRGESTSKKDCLATRRSSLLWTHFGFSGPAAMDVSGAITSLDRCGDAALRFDLTPQISETDWASLLGSTPGRVAKTIARHLPAKLAAALVDSATGGVTDDSVAAQAATTVGGSGAAAGDRVGQSFAQWPKKLRRRLIDSIKRLRVPVAGTRGYDKAEVTAGGVAIGEVDRQTMRSRKIDGLYIAGEVLDVDGPIGGYNFTAAFATGESAGLAAGRALVDRLSSGSTDG